MNRLFSSDGFTLTEVLVALSIMMIISIAFLTLFINSYSDITISGIRNKRLYETQQKIEEAIASGTFSEEKEVIISFPGVNDAIKVTGSIQTEETIVKGNKISISVFIPKSTE